MYLKGQYCNLLTETQKNNADIFNSFIINNMLFYTFLQLTAPGTTIQESSLPRKSINPQQKKRWHLKGMDIRGRKACINNILLSTMHKHNFRRLISDNGLLGASSMQVDISSILILLASQSPFYFCPFLLCLVLSYIYVILNTVHWQ